MGQYTCDECRLSNGWHFDDSDPTQQPRAYRCPNRAITEQVEHARKLGIHQASDRDKAAQAIVHDAAQRFFLFSANHVQSEIADAGLDGDSGVMGRAFTHALREGWIVATGSTEPSTKKSTHGKPVAIYKSKLRAGLEEAV